MAVRIGPSILAADPLNLGADVARVGAADSLHVDVMDSRFVPNLGFGPHVVAGLATFTSQPIDVHLMVEDPLEAARLFVAAGAHSLTVHLEAVADPRTSISRIRDLGVGVGVAVRPGTPIARLEPVVPCVDLVLVMCVEPGFGGQRFLPASIERIAAVRKLLDAQGSDARLQVDGGVGADTIEACAAAGADTFVAGSAVFGAPDPAAAVRDLRERARHPR